MFSRLTGRTLLAVSAPVTAMSFARCGGEEKPAAASSIKKDRTKQKVVIVGGGTAGLGVAAMLRNEGMVDVTVVEPSSTHYYQPLWTVVGAGLKDKTESSKATKDVMPSGVSWVQKRVASFSPASNSLTLDDGSTVGYDYLVVAAGLQINWKNVPGLEDGLNTDGSGVVSIYGGEAQSARVWTEFNGATKGKKDPRLLFTMSPTPIKCAGAPQKIMWLLEDILRDRKQRDGASVEFWTPGGAMFGVKHYSDKLEAIRKDRGVKGVFKHELVGVDAKAKVATFKDLATGALVEEKFDLLHVAPHMGSPDFLKQSPLADKASGWMAVDPATLQATGFPNVFGLGDCTTTPNSKTAAAITSQAPVLVHNLARAIEGKPLDGKYLGYASCPLCVAKGDVMMAEFGYGGKLMETFCCDTGKFPMSLLGVDNAVARRFFYFLKMQVFPNAYWSMWVKGNWYGTNGPFKPNVVPVNDAATK